MSGNMSTKMKFRAHETFFIRKGWLSKGMKYVRQTEGNVFIDKENNPMDTLGIGSNMVKSLRYWLLAVGLTEEKPVIIGEGSWICARAIILPGVCIGKNVIVAAGAVVSKSVPDYSIVAGKPAVVVKQRNEVIG